MDDLLTGLGVPTDIRSWFGIKETLFDFGNSLEHYGQGFLRIPSAKGLWTAGSTYSADVIITFSAMEAIAYLTLNRHRYTEPFDLCFIAVGNSPRPPHLQWIKERFGKRKFTLVLDNDLLGRLWDIKIATSLRNKPVGLCYTDRKVLARFGSRDYSFVPERLTLSLFEKTFGVRTGIRTVKPKHHNSFLALLESGNKI